MKRKCTNNSYVVFKCKQTADFNVYIFSDSNSHKIIDPDKLMIYQKLLENHEKILIIRLNLHMVRF